MLRSWASATYFSQIVETVLTCVLLWLALARPTWGAGCFNAVETRLRVLAGKPRLAVVLLVSGTVVARLLLLPFLPVPAAWIHDEFSYLLAGGTYASGRLTNPTHPMWRHFESVHILQRPTYMSMYAPAQGLFLAAGLKATGIAWAGVVLGVALFCGALFWMLLAWLPSAWALAGTLLVVVRWGLVSYWMNSYWGGAVPALGGALVLGSLPRLLRESRSRDSVLLGLGIALLLNSRPYEGSVLLALSFAILIYLAARSGQLGRLRSAPVLAPLLLIGLIAACGMLFYNGRVTTNALRLPYLEDRDQYSIAPLFILGKLRPEKKFEAPALQKVYEAEVQRYRNAREGFGIPEVFRKLKNFWVFFCGPLLTVPLVFLFFRRAEDADVTCTTTRKWLSFIFLGSLIASLQVVWFYPHYAGPYVAAFVALLLVGMRRLRSWTWKGRPSGLFLCRAIPVTCVLMAAVPACAARLGWRLSYWPPQWAVGATLDVHPPAVTSQLLASGKKALVFVCYGTNHDPGNEWVYNSADIDKAPVVWARHLDPDSDAALLRYFAGRSVWEVDPDQHPAKAVPYSLPQTSTRLSR